MPPLPTDILLFNINERFKHHIYTYFVIVICQDLLKSFGFAMHIPTYHMFAMKGQ